MNLQATPPAGVVATLAELVALRGRLAVPRPGRSGGGAGIAGRRSCPAPARGMEYAESRPYLAGDDVRSIDWRQTARRGTVHTKLFRQEHERPVHLLVDLSAGMRFGTRGAFKSVAAARAAALLAWQAAATGDRVGGTVWTGAGQCELAPQSRESGVLALLRHLAAQSAAAACDGDLKKPLQALARRLGGGGMVVIASDFSGLDAAMAGTIAALAERATVLLAQVHDVFESDPEPALYHVSDGTRTMPLDLRSASAREAHVAPFAARCRLLGELARHARLQVVPLATHEDPMRLLEHVR